MSKHDAKKTGASGGHAPPETNALSRRAAVVIGGVVGVAPVAVGVLPFLDPLRKREGLVEKPAVEGDDGVPGVWVKVTTADQVAAEPKRFTLLADRQDAWNLFRNEPVGAIYLHKQNDGSLRAITVTCPHLGCSVSYDAGSNEGAGGYLCPCHESLFSLAGACLKGPSPRPLDELTVKVLHGNEVWVKFQKFHAGATGKEVEA